jgi:hypothetical protein
VLWLALGILLVGGMLWYISQVEHNLMGELEKQRGLWQQEQLARSLENAPRLKPFELTFSAKHAKAFWQFDKLGVSWLPKSKKEKENFLGAEHLLLEGTVKNWYGGGMGTYLALNAQGFTHLSLNIFGYGKDSGVLKIELTDDDNKNFKAETGLNGKADDIFAYALPVDWQGWRHFNIPFLAFADENPGIGDDQWNPSQWLGSGGLLQIQWIAIGKTAEQNFKMMINKPRIIQIQSKSGKK